jgi:predicted nucleotidyltransferase
MKLKNTYKKVILFLNTHHYDYLVIGGIAASVLGEPRTTGDIDLCIFVAKKGIEKLLDELIGIGFIFDRKIVKTQIMNTGTFKIYCGEIPIDFIIASTEFEKNALKRKIEVKIYGVSTSFPTPEDLILFKIIPGRTIDIADVETIAKRHSGKLDSKYLQSWAMRLSEEAEDMRIYNEIKRLLNL